MTTTPESTRRGPYRRPQLEIYGDIRTITQATGQAAKNKDGGSSGKNKRTDF